MNLKHSNSTGTPRLPSLLILALSACCAIGSSSILSSCSVVMAAKQRDEKNVHVLDIGTPREKVILELGAPVLTETHNGKKEDLFSFVQGYSDATKAGRAFTHFTADFFTLGLWEVVGTPTEAIFDGDEVQFKVYYDSKERVRKIRPIKGDHKLRDVNSQTTPYKPKPAPTKKTSSKNSKKR